MIIANCPRCGSMNNTAGICPNCGWSQFAQVTTVSTRTTGEIEIMLSGKALLDDYKRLLFENNSLTVRIAELRGFINQLIKAGDAMSNAQSTWVAEEDKWDALAKDWKEREKNG